MSTSTKNAHLATTTESDPRWAAVVARDPKATFFYSVKTTGVYCRPSCAARLARPENVQFHGTCKDAEKAGFRPCKRCKPDQTSPVEHSEKISSACRLIENSETPPSLKLLARHVGLSTYHFHRVFKAATGLTPKGYAAAHRASLVRKSLNKSDTVTDAIYDAGYNSKNRFYETSNQVLGMTPSSYRAGGAQTDIRFAVGECSLGSILVAQSGRGICAIFLGDDPDALVRELQDQFPNRLHRRRVRHDGATPAHAEPANGGAAPSGRWYCLRSSQPARAWHAQHVSRKPGTRRHRHTATAP